MGTAGLWLRFAGLDRLRTSGRGHLVYTPLFAGLFGHHDRPRKASARSIVWPIFAQDIEGGLHRIEGRELRWRISVCEQTTDQVATHQTVREDGVDVWRVINPIVRNKVNRKDASLVLCLPSEPIVTSGIVTI